MWEESSVLSPVKACWMEGQKGGEKANDQLSWHKF